MNRKNYAKLASVVQIFTLLVRIFKNFQKYLEIPRRLLRVPFFGKRVNFQEFTSNKIILRIMKSAIRFTFLVFFELKTLRFDCALVKDN